MLSIRIGRKKITLVLSVTLTNVHTKDWNKDRNNRILTLHEEGMSQVNIARKMGITQAMISRILKKMCTCSVNCSRQIHRKRITVR